MTKSEKISTFNELTLTSFSTQEMDLIVQMCTDLVFFFNMSALSNFVFLLLHAKTSLWYVELFTDNCELLIRGMLWFPLERREISYLILLHLSLNRKVHLLGSFQNIKMARTAICNLILGKKDCFYILIQDLITWLMSYLEQNPLNPHVVLRSDL